MSEDQGAKKGVSDAAVKADAAIPAKPAALSDKELEKVAGGRSLDFTNAASWISPVGPTKFGK